MGLQVWLPLNGDLNNYGLSNMQFTNNSAVVNTAGKIGSCYEFNANAYIKESNYNWSSFNISQFSLCCWYKEPSPVTSGNSQMICIGTSSGWNNIRIGLLRRTSTGRPIFSVSDGSSAIQYACSTTANIFTFDAWHHIAVTYNNGTINMYVDGQLDTVYTTTIVPVLTASQHLGIGAASNGAEKLTGFLNDVRIYDHALSAKEVKEIAKGLVLHYKLDGSGTGNNNILLNTHFDTRYNQTTGWDTAKNGTLLANSWGGYNSGVNNQATVYHAHLKEINNEYIYEYIKTANESWLGISQGGLQNKLIAGETYTFSWEEYHVEGTNRVGTGLYYYKTGATSAGFHLGIQQATNITRVIDQWQKYSYTFIAPSDADWAKNISWYIYGDYNGNGTFYMRHPKLELGNSATNWAPNSSDPIYNAMGLNANIIYDTSGYNHATTANTITWSSSSPRYSAAAHFNGTDSYIRVPFNEICPDNIFTINLWFKKDALGSKNYETLFGGPSGFEMDTRAGSSSTLTLYMASTRGGNVFSSFSFSQWYMVTMVRDGTNELYYVNGDLKKTIAAKPMPTGIYRIGAWNGDTGQNYYGEISDFRIYNTVLSADDIKELYNISVSVDNKGNIYAREVIEV